MRISYWSSDVCSSDLGVGLAHDPVAAAQALVQYAKQAARFGHIAVPRPFVFVILAGEFIEETELAEHRPDSAHLEHQPLNRFVARGDRKSVGKGKSVSVRVEIGGRRIIKKKKK